MDIETLLSITSDSSDELGAALLEMLGEADIYFGNRDSTIAWLSKPSVVFKFRSPASVCDDIEGVKLVMEQINRLKFGDLA
ncbi:antitoxin Xre/MbcA/ParS toxin-binding domain-containing protein [Vibrio owensii]|uniref:antitoxin Xre/MbcA/ParS toxin-binding domain-containing protein n=1 Tax=Vibrio owensii TaxID=696485 RepID=UPI003AAC39D2